MADKQYAMVRDDWTYRHVVGDTSGQSLCGRRLTGDPVGDDMPVCELCRRPLARLRALRLPRLRS
jgi:hypothetical protein